jgi:predicted transcriptional regulator
MLVGRVFVYICGSAGPYDEYNPFKVARQEHAPEILYLLNREPLTAEELSKKMSVSVETVSRVLQDLARINAVLERGGRWHVSFPIFTREDLRLLHERARKPALKLAEEIMGMRSKIEELLSKLPCARQVEVGKIALAVVGCHVLDWRALELLNERGLSLCGRKLQPGNRMYVLLGREEGAEEGLIDKMYWGSHSSTFGRFTFVSFGDHTGYRYAFPDAAWSISAAALKSLERRLPDWYCDKVAEASRLLLELSMVEIGNALLTLCEEGPMSVESLGERAGMGKKQAEASVKLLADMKYVRLEGGRVALNYPVFTVEDREVIEEVWRMLSAIVEEAACGYFESLRSELAELTPIRRGFDPREIYTDIWHWVFGWANRIMAERGFFYDPPREREGEARYIAWVEEAGAL